MGLLPDTEYYMTYDGSTTMPACYETVTWIILNKPIYITKQQVKSKVDKFPSYYEFGEWENARPFK